VFVNFQKSSRAEKIQADMYETIFCMINVIVDAAGAHFLRVLTATTVGYVLCNGMDGITVIDLVAEAWCVYDSHP